MSLNSALGWLGRQGTSVIAASLLVGVVLSPLAAVLKPLFPPTIFILLVLAFLRVEPAVLREHFVRPRRVVVASLWVMIALPFLTCFAFLWLQPDRIGDGLLLALILYAAAPPVMSGPAIAALLGLDAALVLAVMIATTASAPIIAALIVSFFAGNSLHLDPIQLATRLTVFLGGSFAVAWLLRRLLGRERIASASGVIDGLSVLALIVFIIALMDGVGARTLREPLLVFGLIVAAFAFVIILYAATSIAFWSAGADKALALGFTAAHRNMGVMMATAGAAAPELTWLYLAAAQFPIYVMPLILKPLVHRILGRRLPGG